MKLLLYTSILVLLNASNCSNRNSFKGIRFGEGGGFTGAVITYEIKSNGDVYKADKKLKTLSDSDLNAIQKKIDNLSNESLSFNHPFNLYHFITTDKANIVWGDPAFPEPSDIKELYAELQKSINQ